MKMLQNNLRLAGVAAIVAAVLGLGIGTAGAGSPKHPMIDDSIVASMFAMGLSNPRGLKFGLDGDLYVAEGGFPTGDVTGAPVGLGGNCSAGSGGPGEYFGSTTGSRISKINRRGSVETFVDNLPSARQAGWRAALRISHSSVTRCTRYWRARGAPMECLAFRMGSSA